MGFPFVYCVVCGCPFDIPPHDETLDDRWASNDPLEDETKQWMMEIRLLGATRSLESFATPPFRMPRNESEVDGIFISESAGWTSTEGFYFRLGEDPYRVLSSAADDSNDVIFPLHDNCLRLLRRALARRADISPGYPVDLADVYKSLCTKFSHNVAESKRLTKASGFCGADDYMNYGMEYEHGYYGAREFWRFGGWEVAASNEWYCNDPIDIPGLVEFVSGLLAEVGTDEKVTSKNNEALVVRTNDDSISRATKPGPYLEGLPRELLDLVISSLPTPTTLSLRQCSRALATRIPLDQRFWREQLRAGRAIPYIWDLDDDDILGCDKPPNSPRESGRDKLTRGPSNTALASEFACWDWRGLARTLARLDFIGEADVVRFASAPWGFRNRCRIWRLVNDIIALPID